MNSIWSRNIIRGVFILAIQLILLKRVNLAFGDFNYVHLTIYSLIIALIPYRTPRAALIAFGFLLGLFVDMFYDSLGVHAAATTFIAFVRYYVLAFISPREGYKKNELTAYVYGITWFLSYMSLLLFIHLSVIYSLEAFSFVYLKEILFRTIFSFLASLFLLMIGYLIFNPKY